MTLPLNGLRWGIMGAGIIAEKMAKAIIETPGSSLLAVASKSPEKASSFAAKYSLEQRADVAPLTYQTLCAHPDIDVVYIATTHNFHFENGMMALSAGKHVLIEKPFAVNAAQARKLQALAREKGLFLMEGLWTRCLPAMHLLKQMLDDGEIGEVKAIHITFGSMASARYQQRLYSLELAGGVTLDMGIYPLSVACFLLGSLPTEVQSMARFRESGVDEMAQYMLRFSGDRFANLLSSFSLRLPNEALVFGSEGRVQFPNFHQGNAFEVLHYADNGAIAERKWHRPKQADNGFVHEVEEVMRCIHAGKLESDLMPLDESIAMMQIMDGMREGWGLKYPFE